MESQGSQTPRSVVTSCPAAGGTAAVVSNAAAPCVVPEVSCGPATRWQRGALTDNKCDFEMTDV
jgi:hypothetical protein